MKLGTVDRRFCCHTCKQDVMSCIGHMGHIDLAYPVYHIGYIDVILKLLRTVCYFCSSFIVPHTNSKISIMHRRYHSKATHSTSEHKQFLTAASNICKTKKVCSQCKCNQPCYMKSGTQITAKFATLTEEENALVKGPFTALNALSIITSISDEDLKFLGFLDPQMLRDSIIMVRLIVPPPIMRPTIMVSDGSRIRGQDDLTIRLQDIVKQNKTIMNHAEYVKWDRDIPTELHKHYVALQHLVAVYINHDIKAPASFHKNGRSSGPCRSLFYRLRGKRGRVRGNLMGKRCDYSSRTVITPDPYMDIDCIGVPEHIALRQTVPEMVNIYNIDKAREWIRKGDGVIGGCKSITVSGKGTFYLSMLKNRNMVVKCGDVINRYLQDDDWIMFNRQPSLHKQSIMGHRVKLMKGLTFRLPVCCTTPYNADFDGDEMNMHVCQNRGALCEIANIMNANNQIISAQSNKPIISLVQDVLIGAYMMTSKDIFVRDIDYVTICCGAVRGHLGTLPEPAIEFPCRLWTGKQLISEAIPDITLTRGSKYSIVKETPDSETDGCTCIQRGALLSGVLCKQTLGGVSGGIIHIICKDKGCTLAGAFIGNCQRLVHRWIEIHGFSIGIKDCVTPSSTQQRVKNIIKTEFSKIEAVDANISEATISQTLQSVLDKTGRMVLQDIDTKNSIYQAVMSGSKGNPINISQIMACVGQQSVEGNRINVNSKYKSRGLSCFDKSSKYPAANGFVSSSYMSGLSMQEYFFHSMGGREGLVDTAVKTAATGYISRRLIKVMESVHISYDNTVRSGIGEIIQFSYGNDNINTTFIEKVNVPMFLWNKSRLQSIFSSTTPLGADDTQKELLAADMRKERQEFMDLHCWMLENRTDEDEDTLYLPVNISRLLSYYTKSGKGTLRLYRPKEIVDRLCNKLISFKENTRECTAALRYIIKFHLNTRSILCVYNLLEEELTNLCSTVISEYKRAIVQPGEMVGPIAASSIGEPCTQMTLNTFHYAGVLSKNVTLGVPRFKELIDCSKTIKTPSIKIYMNRELRNSRAVCAKIGKQLQICKMDTIMVRSRLHVEGESGRLAYPEDQPLLRTYAQMSIDKDAPLGQGEHMQIRCELSMPIMEDMFVTCSTVLERVQQVLGPKFYIVISNDNSMSRVMIIRHMDIKTTPRKDREAALRRVHQYELQDIVLSGIDNIDKATPFCANGEWISETDGTNLIKVMQQPYVDFSRTVSNDVNEVSKVLGIEAAVNVLYKEIKTVLSFDGTYVNHKHIMLLVDTMTFNGFLCPVSRHGMAKSNLGPLMRASFEETVDVLLDAAIYNGTDNITGVTENIMMGNLAPIGTGFFDLDTNHELCKSQQGNKMCNIEISRPTHRRAQQDDRDSRPFVGRKITHYKSSNTYTPHQKDRIVKTTGGEVEEGFVPMSPKLYTIEVNHS